MKIEENKSSLTDKFHWHKMKALTAVFNDAHHAHEVAGQLVEHDFPMDQISVLHLPSGQGNDFLGLSYDNDRKRTIVWSENGALWGALVGLAVGASGILFVPGVGLLLALGPVIDPIAGAVIGSALMAGSAQATRIASAFHKIGIPEDESDSLQKALMAGKTILILHYSKDDQVDWQQAINWSSAESVQVFSGSGLEEEASVEA